jgi:hypothetical protein
MRASLAAAAAVASGALLARTAPAKEHAAACAALPSIIDGLRGALVLAAFHRGRGSSLAAYEVLRTTVASVTLDRETADCGVVPAVLAGALARAGNETSALAASLQIDQGIAAALSVALVGRTTNQEAAAKLIEVGESVEYGAGCPDVFSLVRRLASPPDGGGPPVPTTELVRRTGELVSELRAQGRCAAVARLLGTASRDELAHAVDSLRLDEADLTTDTQNPLVRCPELPLVVERIGAAINLGAPLFNKGDRAGCRDLYRRVARSLRDEVIPAGRCPAARAELDASLTAAAQASEPGQAAWALRNGFDRIMERWQTPSP